MGWCAARASRTLYCVGTGSRSASGRRRYSDGTGRATLFAEPCFRRFRGSLRLTMQARERKQQLLTAPSLSLLPHRQWASAYRGRSCCALHSRTSLLRSGRCSQYFPIFPIFKPSDGWAVRASGPARGSPMPPALFAAKHPSFRVCPAAKRHE